MIYAYNNANNGVPQITESAIAWGLLQGMMIDQVYTMAKFRRTDSGRLITPSREEDAEQQLLEVVAPEDVVVTSSLTNFSLDFVSAIQTVAAFDKCQTRVIAYMEQFDSASEEGQTLIASVSMMRSFRKNAFAARRKVREAGIKRAAEEGRYKGRQAYGINDFPNFRELYNQYMYREIGKGEFAEKLGVSRPTLDRLLKDFTQTK